VLAFSIELLHRVLVRLMRQMAQMNVQDLRAAQATSLSPRTTIIHSLVEIADVFRLLEYQAVLSRELNWTQAEDHTIEIMSGKQATILADNHVDYLLYR
jgi:hypothetical protein